MNYQNMNSKWEEFFLQEAITLEEKMNLLSAEALNQSRIRISLENNILAWEKYQNWFLQQYGCTSLKSDLTQDQLLLLRSDAAKTLAAYSHFEFWNEDLVPVGIWDGHLIVAGLEFNENLVQIPNIIFVLTEPFILSFISDRLSGTEDSEKFMVEDSSDTQIGGIDLNISSSTLSFDSVSLLSASKPAKSETAIWDYLTERHDEYSFEAKKLFSAYVVLKIVEGKTQVFKMDSELEKYLKQKDVFVYDVKEENPFGRIFNSGISESFNISQLSHPVMDFKYICITALKRGNDTVGFLLGLQTKKLAETDQLLLEDLAKESA